MDKQYSILVLPSRGTRIRRLAFSRRWIRCLLSVGAILVGMSGWLLGDYFWVKLQMKLQGKDLRQLREDVQIQQERIAALQGQTGHIQRLLANWKGLQGRIRASLPHGHAYSPGGHPTIAQLEKSLTLLQYELEGLIASVPSDWPADGRVSSGIGMRLSPWTGKPEFHSGLDIPNPVGTPVYAPGEGVVEFVAESNGNGSIMILNHGQGITTQYAHLSRIHVKKSERVHKGGLIASIGNTGKSTGPHLHYEVRVNGVPIDPRRSLIQ